MGLRPNRKINFWLLVSIIPTFFAWSYFYNDQGYYDFFYRALDSNGNVLLLHPRHYVDHLMNHYRNLVLSYLVMCYISRWRPLMIASRLIFFLMIVKLVSYLLFYNTVPVQIYSVALMGYLIFEYIYWRLK